MLELIAFPDILLDLDTMYDASGARASRTNNILACLNTGVTRKPAKESLAQPLNGLCRDERCIDDKS